MLDWKSWLSRVFNPATKIMRKMNEYASCIQGRRSVDDYLEEHLLLRSFCTSKGDDQSQKLQFLRGLHPELYEEVGKQMAGLPCTTFHETMELARNLAPFLSKHSGVRAVHGRSDVLCFNCHEMGHFAVDCTAERKVSKDGCVRCGKPGHRSRDCGAENQPRKTASNTQDKEENEDAARPRGSRSRRRARRT